MLLFVILYEVECTLHIDFKWVFLGKEILLIPLILEDLCIHLLAKFFQVYLGISPATELVVAMSENLQIA